jgi:hypothetical protein
VGFALLSLLIRRPQSVLDLVEVEARFAGSRFAEGDDTDFIVGLGVGYRNRYSCQEAQRDEALLPVVEAIVLVAEGEALKDASRVYEVQTMLLEVDGALALGP